MKADEDIDRMLDRALAEIVGPVVRPNMAAEGDHLSALDHLIDGVVVAAAVGQQGLAGAPDACAADGRESVGEHTSLHSGQLMSGARVSSIRQAAMETPNLELEDEPVSFGPMEAGRVSFGIQQEMDAPRLWVAEMPAPAGVRGHAAEANNIDALVDEAIAAALHEPCRTKHGEDKGHFTGSRVSSSPFGSGASTTSGGASAMGPVNSNAFGSGGSAMSIGHLVGARLGCGSFGSAAGAAATGGLAGAIRLSASAFEGPGGAGVVRRPSSSAWGGAAEGEKARGGSSSRAGLAALAEGGRIPAAVALAYVVKGSSGAKPRQPFVPTPPSCPKSRAACTRPASPCRRVRLANQHAGT